MFEAEIEALKKHCDEATLHVEANVTYIYLKKLRLPENCSPSVVNAVLCPTPRDGYGSRLGFEVQIATPNARNWQQIRVLDRNWSAFSWNFPFAGLDLLHILLGHFEGLTSAR